MSTLTERTSLHSITAYADGRVEIVRLLQALRGDEVIHSIDSLLRLAPGDALPDDLDAQTMAIIAAVWTSEKMDAAVSDLREKMRAEFDALDTDERLRAESLERARKRNEEDAAAIGKAREAIAATHQELDAEHATLNARSDEITRRRAELFEKGEKVRAGIDPGPVSGGAHP